ncbi:hypothetical protein Sru01_08970 [Sphaerisporangium rufum]|uniref:Uncharacterized protein n=1 Tax=Sphaerisporangium rufum TaxID=1381558 RepID=A0A919V338_9ACTN|nr:V-type ATP synthase subunit E family protein [Sphaerisporangium rufum]GII75915.1 hypothetical protein Sru01_08970 [Sphaerisporangium rufum]
MSGEAVSRSPVERALAPLAAELLRRAGREAAGTAARARAEAASIDAAARREAARVLAAARESGRAEHAAEAARALAEARREGRRAVLAAQRQALEEFRRRAREAAGGLRADPGYPALLRALTEAARRRGGTELAIREHPDGGVVGEGPGRRVDATLPVLADRMVDSLAGEVCRLWLP